MGGVYDVCQPHGHQARPVLRMQGGHAPAPLHWIGQCHAGWLQLHRSRSMHRSITT